LWAWLLGFLLFQSGDRRNWVLAVAAIGIPLVYVNPISDQAPLSVVTYSLVLLIIMMAGTLK